MDSMIQADWVISAPLANGVFVAQNVFFHVADTISDEANAAFREADATSRSRFVAYREAEMAALGRK